MIKLITLLAGGIPAILSGILLFLARKWGTVAATITLFVALTVAMIACINSILSTVIGLITVPAWLLNALGMFIPASFGPTLAAILSAKTCRAAYDLAMAKAKAFNNAS